MLSLPSTPLVEQEPMDTCGNDENQKAKCEDCQQLKTEMNQMITILTHTVFQLQCRLQIIEETTKKAQMLEATRKANDVIASFPVETVKVVKEEIGVEEKNDFLEQLQKAFAIQKDLKEEIVVDSASSSSTCSPPSTSTPAVAEPTSPVQISINSVIADSLALSQITPKQKKEITLSTPSVCTNCQSEQTSTWRRDSNYQLVCNACGLYERIHKKNRPASLKKDTIQQRRRQSKIKTSDGTLGSILKTIPSQSDTDGFMIQLMAMAVAQQQQQ